MRVSVTNRGSDDESGLNVTLRLVVADLGSVCVVYG